MRHTLALHALQVYLHEDDSEFFKTCNVSTQYTHRNVRLNHYSVNLTYCMGNQLECLFRHFTDSNRLKDRLGFFQVNLNKMFKSDMYNERTCDDAKMKNPGFGFAVSVLWRAAHLWPRWSSKWQRNYLNYQQQHPMRGERSAGGGWAWCVSINRWLTVKQVKQQLKRWQLKTFRIRKPK